MGQTLRLSRVVLGLIWSGLLVCIGLWLLRTAPPPAWLCSVTAGQFVLMVLVCDHVCPAADRVVTGMLKLTAAMVFWLALGLSLWMYGSAIAAML